GAGAGTVEHEDQLTRHELRITGPALPCQLLEVLLQLALDPGGDLAGRVLGVLELDLHGQIRAAAVLGRRRDLLGTLEDVHDLLTRGKPRVWWRQESRRLRGASLQAGGEHLVLGREQLVHRTLRHARRLAQRVHTDAHPVAIRECRDRLQKAFTGARGSSRRHWRLRRRLRRWALRCRLGFGDVGAHGFEGTASTRQRKQIGLQLPEQETDRFPAGVSASPPAHPTRGAPDPTVGTSRKQARTMMLNGSIALVTGGNRGLGDKFVRTLLDSGASKVYAAARDPRTVTAAGAIPIALDVTDHASVLAAAEQAQDVTLLINNAGSSTGTNLLEGDFA